MNGIYLLVADIHLFCFVFTAAFAEDEAVEVFVFI